MENLNIKVKSFFSKGFKVTTVVKILEGDKTIFVKEYKNSIPTNKMKQPKSWETFKDSEKTRFEKMYSNKKDLEQIYFALKFDNEREDSDNKKELNEIQKEMIKLGIKKVSDFI